jgi:hypothetical protein
MSPNELNLWNWYHDSIGVKKNKYSNKSFRSMHLFYAKSGFTNFGYNHLKTYEEKIQRFKELGADNLIINDTTLLKKLTHIRMS